MHFLKASVAALLVFWGTLASPVQAREPLKIDSSKVIPVSTRPEISFDLTPEAIKDQCQQAQKATDQGIQRLLAIPSAKRTFTNTVLASENAQTGPLTALGAALFLKNVSLDPKIRAASLQCSTDYSSYLIRLGSRVDLYQAYLTVAKRSDQKLTPVQAKLLDRYLTDARRAGSALSPAKRAGVTKLKEQLSKLEDDFAANLSNNNATVEVTRAELEGLPEDFINRLQRNDKGSYVLTLKTSDYVPFMENARDPQVRRRVEGAYQNREAQANIPLLERAIALRDEIAQMMGYPNHSAFVLAERMAGNPQRVEAFLEDLRKRLKIKTQQEIQVLLALKQKDDPTATQIEMGDWRYYANQLKKTQYAVDNEQVRAYFPVDHVITSVFEIYQKLLGVEFEELPAQAWAPEVRLFAIRDSRDHRLLAHFYADLYPRPGKYNHFAAFPLSSGFRNPDGSYHRPISAMVGNWPQGTADKPALLSHEDVVTFFHEFGHIMHQTLTTAPYSSLAGTQVRGDFVEAPSQMLENWVWNPTLLKQISKHYQTGQTLPDALIAKMVTARHVNEGIFTSRQLFLATVDYRYHTTGPKVDTTRIWRELYPTITGIQSLPDIHPQAAFNHLMSGYDSGYYGYLWSKVFAQDMFTRFEQGGLTSSIVGAAYRQAILEPGGSREPDQLLRRFLGREPNKEAFYRDLGL